MEPSGVRRLNSDRLGALTLGHQTPFNFDWLDPLSSAFLAQSWYAFHPGNLDQLADTSTVPFNNSVKYRSPVFAGFTVGAMLGFGNTTNFSTGRTMSFGVNYANGPFKAAAVYSNEHDQAFPMATVGGIAGPGGTFQGMPVASYVAKKAQNMGAGLSYRFGPLLVHGLYTRVKLQANGHSDTFQSYDAGANYQSSPFNVIAGGAATSTLAGRRWSQFELGDTYSLSKRTQLYVNVLYEHASGNAKAAFFTAGASSTANQVIVLTGIHHSF